MDEQQLLIAIGKMMDEKINVLENKMDEKFSTLQEEVKAIKDDVKEIKEDTTDIRKKMNILYDWTDSIELRVHDIEHASK